MAAACSACRKSKAKVTPLHPVHTYSLHVEDSFAGQCSGERPVCGRCASRQLDCHYTTEPGETEAQARSRAQRDLRHRAAAHTELVELLTSLPERDAQDVLQRMRSGDDIATILRHVKAGDVLLQMAVVPEIRLRYDFPYGSEMPQEYVLDNPYLDSLIYEASSLYPAGGLPGISRPASADSDTTWQPQGFRSLYLAPLHAAAVVEPRLSEVRLSYWTSVCDNDALMRDLLGTWLRCEYHFTAAFQKDLFLEDMAAQREDFCSPLLVNIVLGYACVRYI